LPFRIIFELPFSFYFRSADDDARYFDFAILGMPSMIMPSDAMLFSSRPS